MKGELLYPRFFLHYFLLGILFFLLIFVEIILAQKSEITFQRFTTEKGLPDNFISSIVQDQNGFLWIGTGHGLVRYDGYHFKAYENNPNNPNSISSNTIDCVVLGTFNNKPALWVGTKSGGLNVLDLGTESFKNWQHQSDNPYSISHNWVNTIHQLNDSTIYIGTYGGGINLFNTKTEKFQNWQFTSESMESVRQNLIEDIFFNRTDSSFIWVATNAGLYTFNIKTKHYEEPWASHRFILKAINEKIIRTIHEDKQGLLWIGSWRSGLLCIDLKQISLKQWKDDPNNPSESGSFEITDILPGDEDNLWLGTFNNGLKFFDTHSEEFITWNYNPSNNSSISHNSIETIFKDKTGITWIGTFNGLNKMLTQRNPFKILQHDPDESNSLDNNYVWSVFEDTKGIIWIGTSTKLNRFDRKKGEISHLDPLPGRNPGAYSANAILTIIEEKNGNLWLGTFGAGLIKYNPDNGIYTKWLISEQEEGNNNLNMIYSIIEDDKTGRLWLATEAGTRLFDKDLERISIPPMGSQEHQPEINAHINTIYKSPNGSIWIGTLESGLSLWDDDEQKFHRWSHNPEDPNSLSGNSITCIYMVNNDDNVVWIGTEGNGLNRLDLTRGKIKHWNQQDGLQSNSIHSILADSKNHLWISTDKGLSRFNPEDESFSHFEINAGTNSFNFGPFAACGAQSGELFFGGSSGLLYFYPDQIQQKQSPSKLTLTDFRIFNHPVTIGKDSPLQKTIKNTNSLKLSYQEHLFSFEFAIMDFLAPEKNIYAYYLEGFHEEWVELGTRNFVEFTNLEPGSYTFSVKGANSSGIWSNDNPSIHLTITPPFWETWWFRLITFILVIGILYTIYKIRVNSLLQIERTRTGIARDLHDDLSATLSSIYYFAAAIKEDRPKSLSKNASKFLSLISEGTSEAQEKIQDIIWAINTENDSWDQVLLKCRRYASDLLDSKDIDYQLEIPSDLAIHKLSMQQRRNFWMIYKEILTNVVKHSRASKSNISIKSQNNKILLEISDNGVGFNPEQKSKRNGLKNIRNRANQLQARITLDTAPEKGTKWSIEF
jgi:ligand-binding sensor domain-containing protein